MKTALVENTWLRTPEKTDWIRDDRPEPKFTFDCGWGNGYVLIPEGHPLHGTHYNNINVDVHGGLTFSELVTEEMLEIFNLEKEDIGKWCVGLIPLIIKIPLKNGQKKEFKKKLITYYNNLLNINGS